MAARSAGAVVVVTGGDPVDRAVLADLPAGAPVVAADSGLDEAHRLGLRVHTAVGDFDSASPGALERAAAEGALVDHHPEAKDATDLELALQAACRLEPERLIVLGGHGGRLDHLLANALALAAPALADVEVVAHMGRARVAVVRPGRRTVLEGQPGDLVTLLPAHGPARGVRTDGLLYPLHQEDLRPGSTRGVSNELARPRATVELRAGVLLAVQPGERGTHLLHPPPDP
jgi:thiamine pyrophosphokinase